MSAQVEKLLVRFRAVDNRFGVTRATLAKLAEHFTITEEEVTTARETIEFKLPRGLEVAA